MKRKVKSLSLFYKYLLSFLAVALIPFLIAMTLFYTYNINQLEEQAVTIGLYKLRQAAGLLDDVISNHHRIVTGITTNNKLKKSNLLGDTYSRYECDKALRSYFGRNSGFERAFLLMDERDYVYSGGGIMSYAVFLRNEMKFPSDYAGMLDEALRTMKGPVQLPSRRFLTPAEDDNGYIAFAYPVPATMPFARLLVFVYGDQVVSTLQAGFDKVLSGVAILAKDNTPLFSSFEAEDLEEILPVFGERLPESGGSFEMRRYAGEEHRIVLYYRAPKTGLLYAVAMPATWGANFVYPQKLLFSFGFLVLFLCVLLALGLSFFNYRPIRELLRLVDISGGKRNEIEAIREYIADRNSIAESFARQEPYLQQRVMELYLDGLIEPAEFLGTFRDFRYEAPGNAYFVAAISLYREDGGIVLSLYRQEILNLSLEMQMRHPCHICCIERLQESTMLWVINIRDTQSVAAFISHMGLGVQQLLEENRTLRHVIGIGSVIEAVEDIRDSYFEALASAEFLEKNQTGQVLLYEDMKNALPQSKGLDSEAIPKLIQALKHGDKNLSVSIYRQYHSRLAEEYRSHLLFTYFLYLTLRSIREALAGTLPHELMNRLSDLIACGNSDEFLSAMNRTIADICHHTSHMQQSRQDELSEKILEYIQKNALDPAMSLEKLGDEFSLSPYYISRFVAEKTGENIKNYITQLRMKEAKRLLRDTQLPVHDIVLRVGYFDTSSFIRKFKKETGHTPGEYRTLGNATVGVE